MTPLDPYDQWREHRRTQEPRDGFADRVMAAICAEAANQHAHTAGKLWFLARIAQRRRGLLIAVGASAFAARVAAALALFVTT